MPWAQSEQFRPRVAAHLFADQGGKARTRIAGGSSALCSRPWGSNLFPLSSRNFGKTRACTACSALRQSHSSPMDDPNLRNKLRRNSSGFASSGILAWLCCEPARDSLRAWPENTVFSGA